VRNELVKCLTSTIDQFTTASHIGYKPNLVFQFMAVMKPNGLWPVRPVTSRLKSLEEQLTSFSSLELPNIRADRDSPYQPSSSPRTKKDRYNNGGWDGSFIPRRSSLNSSASSVKVKAVPTDRSPTLRTLSDLTARLKGLCVGLCLDCLKGNDVCRSPHPDPWVAYRRSLGLWFEENTDPEENVSPIQWPAWESVDGHDLDMFGMYD
jgi:hypothetical protein